MPYYVYLITTNINNKNISYVGYTNCISKRLILHNQGKGAKFTRGKNWKLKYYKKYSTKKKAMVEEYKLKKNYKLRQFIKCQKK